MAKIGTIIGGQYEILKQIGHGGMSTVYLGMGKRLGKNWAIKEAKRGEDNSKSARFFEATPIEEANFLKDLHHKNIVSVTDIIEQDGYTYIVEEYLPGSDLEEVMKKGPAPVQDIVNWGTQICDALSYLHARNIIYRDMKPANVRLDAEGDRVILMDFGIAKRYDPANPADKFKVGTKGYAPQEQFKGMTDQRSDIYSLGITLKALLLGISPYEPAFNNPQSAARINGENGDGLLRVLNRATNPDPEKRYQTAEAFGKAIKNYEQISAKYRAKLKKQRNTFLGFAAATVVCLLMALAFNISFVASKNAPMKKIASADSYTEVQKGFDSIIKKNAKGEQKVEIEFGSALSKKAAVNIVDLFVTGKDKDVNALKACLKKYYVWANQPKEVSSDENYAALIAEIYSKDADKSADVNAAIMLAVCQDYEQLEEFKEFKINLGNYNDALNNKDKAIKEFFTKTKDALNIVDTPNVWQYTGRDKTTETEEYKTLKDYIVYLEGLKTDSRFNPYLNNGLTKMIEELKTKCNDKLSDMKTTANSAQ